MSFDNTSQSYSMLCVYEPIYSRGFIAAILSLDRLIHTPQHILVCSTTENLRGLLRLIDMLASKDVDVARLKIVIVGSPVINKCATLRFAEHFSAAICYRIFYDEIIVDLPGVLIYFDLDMMWLTSPDNLLEELRATDGLLAVPQDVPTDYSSHVGSNITDYFNSGLLVINCNEAGKGNIDLTKRALKEIASWSVYLDQDALNIGFSGHWRALDPSWNVMTRDATPDKIASANLLHASGALKPWHFPNKHPYFETYRELFSSYGFGLATTFDLQASLMRLFRGVRRRFAKFAL